MWTFGITFGLHKMFSRQQTWIARITLCMNTTVGRRWTLAEHVICAKHTTVIVKQGLIA